VAFDPLPSRVQRRLDALLGRLARGPTALARGTPIAPAIPRPIAPLAGATGPAASAAAPVGDRRRLPRGRLDREAVALDATGTRVIHALVGRDLSPAGMRIDPHPELGPNERLRIALYEASESGPLVLDAAVARDDGESGLMLRFLDVAPELAARLERIVAALPAAESLRPAPRRIVLGEYLCDRAAA
jgi:hypothetical protein